MKVKEFIERYLVDNDSITFINARARKDENTPFNHIEYQTTPIMCVYEVLKSDLADYNILNDAQPPIDWLSGARWQKIYNGGLLASLLVISDDDIKIYFSEEQAKDMLEYIERDIMRRKGAGRGRRR